MTLQQAIKRYNLIKQEKDFCGAKLPSEYICYTSEKHNEKADYFYCVDKYTQDKYYILCVQTFYKGTNKETLRNYILEN